MKRKIALKIYDYIMYAAGCSIYSIAVVMFITPAQMTPGGVTGIAAVIRLFSDIPVGLTVLIINIPLLIFAYFKLGKSLLLNTGVATVLVSLSLSVAERLIVPHNFDPMLCAIFGGMLMGTGLGLVFLRGATTGGFDILVRLVCAKRPHLTFGKVFLALDAAVITLNSIVYQNFELALYSALCIYISSKSMDYIVYGSGGGKLIITVTEKAQEIAGEIMQNVKRGVTRIAAIGGYTGREKQVILCAARRHEAARIVNIITEIDRDAFSIITDAADIAGYGFGKE